MEKITLPKGTLVPNHLVLIPDGDRRWARARGKSSQEGHKAGIANMIKLMRLSRKLGVHTVSTWGLSTENWLERPRDEVEYLMKNIVRTIDEYIAEAKKEKVRLVHIGRKDRLPKFLLNKIAKAEAETRNYTKYIMNVGLDYGGHDEMLRAIRKVVVSGVKESEIDKELIASYLDTANQPYPYVDFYIRTGGEQRTSGFLLWQSEYAEFYWEDAHFPDFDGEKLKQAILDYSRRRRRFGGNDAAKHFEFKPEITAGLELAWWRLGKIPEGTRFRDYAINHLAEQFGLSKKLATRAAKYFVQAVLEGNDKKWSKSKKSIHEFYELIREELKLAFEPKVVASLQVKLWKDLQDQKSIEKALSAEGTARELYAEVYRISLFQAAKLAHLRILASVERNLALAGMGEHHWAKAEDYLQRFYRDLKERVA